MVKTSFLLVQCRSVTAVQCLVYDIALIFLVQEHLSNAKGCVDISFLAQ